MEKSEMLLQILVREPIQNPASATTRMTMSTLVMELTILSYLRSGNPKMMMNQFIT